ncbi:V-type ATP synthase subunit D [archaeon]|nr:V-type ATP synthase subunit D [archaeon]
MAEKIEGVKPTRMELLRLKRKTKLAVKGHRLLKQKRDALIMEFFNILEEAKGVRKEANESLIKAFESIILARGTLGTMTVTQASMATGDVAPLETQTKSIMGVKVPTLKLEESQRDASNRGYSLIDTSSKLDEAAEQFEKALAVVVQLAEVEKTIRLLAAEIESTKRRVNALENIVIPRLTGTVKYIKMRLDEMERENFFKLKRIKAAIDEG